MSYFVYVFADGTHLFGANEDDLAASEVLYNAIERGVRGVWTTDEETVCIATDLLVSVIEMEDGIVVDSDHARRSILRIERNDSEEPFYRDDTAIEDAMVVLEENGYLIDNNGNDHFEDEIAYLHEYDYGNYTVSAVNAPDKDEDLNVFVIETRSGVNFTITSKRDLNSLTDDVHVHWGTFMDFTLSESGKRVSVRASVIDIITEA